AETGVRRRGLVCGGQRRGVVVDRGLDVAQVGGQGTDEGVLGAGVRGGRGRGRGRLAGRAAAGGEYQDEDGGGLHVTLSVSWPSKLPPVYVACTGIRYVPVTRPEASSRTAA